jgi:hypothetical protein
MEYKIEMPYIGYCLSKNGSKWPGNKRGFLPVTKRWMKDLEEKVRNSEVQKAERYEIQLSGEFKSNVRPDLANLHEILGDAIKAGLGVDDKYFYFRDLDCGFSVFPRLLITIIPEGYKAEPNSLK